MSMLMMASSPLPKSGLLRGRNMIEIEAWGPREAKRMSTDQQDAPRRPKPSVYERLMPNASMLTKVVASTVMHNKIREEEDWEREVYGTRGESSHENALMDALISNTRKGVESELKSGNKRQSEEQDRGDSISKKAKVDADVDAAPHAPLEPHPLAAWRQYPDGQGNFYWYNSNTGVSQWEVPTLSST